MKINQLRNIHNWVRQSEVSEILFVSALVMPIYLLLYNYAAEQINSEWKKWILGTSVLVYIFGIIWMKHSQSKEEQNKKDILVIKNFILDKGFKLMSFEKINEINEKYTEERVLELMLNYPNEMRLAKLKGNKRGIKILNIDNEE